MNEDRKGAAGGTATAPLFLQTALDLAQRLTGDSSPLSSGMRNEALELANSFERWQVERPTNEDRLKTIKRLLDLQRRAMDHLIK